MELSAKLCLHSQPEDQMLNPGRLIIALVVTVATAQLAWKKEDGWIASCTAAGCPGMRSPCLSYVANGTTYYCYRNADDR